MAKRYVAFGMSAADALVARFLKIKGIDPKDITGYRLSRSVDNFGTISIDMWFDDIPEDDIVIPPADTEQQEEPNG